MTKKQNTLLFVFIGTIVNILITLIVIAIILFVAITFFPTALQYIIPFTFIFAVLIGMFIYKRLVFWVVEKFQLEDKIEPLFKKRKKYPKNKDY